MKLIITILASIFCTAGMAQQMPIKKDVGGTAKPSHVNVTTQRAPIKMGGGPATNKTAADGGANSKKLPIKTGSGATANYAAANATTAKLPIKTSDGGGAAKVATPANTNAAQLPNTPSATPVKKAQ